MGLLDLHAAQAGINEPPLQALPRSVGERVEATAAETFAPDRYFTITGARRDAWQRSVDELHGATGETFANPYGAVTSEEMMRLGNQPAIVEERRNRIIEASRTAKASGNDNLYDPENIDRYIGEEAQRRRDTAASYEGTGNGIINFLAGAAMSSIEPVNVLALGLPVSRLPMAAASAVGRTFLGNVAREAALQAGTNVALQGVTEALDYSSRSETGTAQTLGEIGANMAGAAVFGGLIGGGIRALHLKWLGLPDDVRAKAPLEVRDAFRAIEADAIYSGQNRLGVDPMLHERYQGNALDAVMRGKPVDFAELNRTADTPMTALGTILQRAPDRIQADIRLPGEGPAPGMVRMYHGGENATGGGSRHVTPNLDYATNWRKGNPVWYVDVPENSPWLVDSVDVSGTNMPRVIGNSVAPAEVMAGARRVDTGQAAALRSAVDRVRALPDSEIEAFARETKPNSFARLDKVETQLADLRAQHAEISQRTPTLADVVDPDTAMRLQDIERDLSAPALTRKERTQLEQERDMIAQTVDPGDRLPKQAEKAQRAEVATIEKQIAKLEAQREEAKTTADQATADLRRKLDRHAELVSPAADVAKDLGFNAPADLGAAIARADALRQARMVREIMPEGERPPIDTKVNAETKAPVEPTPEDLKILETQAAAVLETPGRMGNLREAAQRDLDAADLQMKDAQAALGCAMGAL